MTSAALIVWLLTIMEPILSVQPPCRGPTATSVEDYLGSFPRVSRVELLRGIDLARFMNTFNAIDPPTSLVVDEISVFQSAQRPSVVYLIFSRGGCLVLDLVMPRDEYYFIRDGKIPPAERET